MIYFDNASTTRVCDEGVKAAMEAMNESFGNPSSLHRLGITAENIISTSRREVLNALGVKSGTVYFTSGGTESNNTALFSVAEWKKARGNRIIVSSVEHASVLNSAKELARRGWDVVYLDVDKSGIVDLKKLEESVDSNTVLVSIAAVNNEIGTIQPINDISRIIKSKNPNCVFHSDFVQAFSKIRVDCSLVDMASISAHKINGMKGCGALYVSDKVNPVPFLYGGGQEKKFRSGTENVPGIASFGAACKWYKGQRADNYTWVSELRQEAVNAIAASIPQAKIISDTDNSSPYILSVTLAPLRGETVLHSLESKGVFVSTGAACSSNKNTVSHVLKAIGLDKKTAEGVIRISFSPANTKEEVFEFIAILKDVVEDLTF
ncbi:MAG: cysteine desulfurase [Clostridiales bacterium]|nr:cysteine desulfurase [Clostridiales bacterium]